MKVISRRMNADKRYMTIKEYCAFARIGHTTAYKRINAGIVRIYQPEPRGKVLIELDTGEKIPDLAILAPTPERRRGAFSATSRVELLDWPLLERSDL